MEKHAQKTGGHHSNLKDYRLLVKKIPKDLPVREVRRVLRKLFPTMQKIFTKEPLKNKNGNRRYAFVTFATQSEALKAKNSTSQGTIKLWGHDFYVNWRNTMRKTSSNVNKTEKSALRDSGVVAKPSAQQSGNDDYVSILHLKCSANKWPTPTVIFGTFFQNIGIQYAAVVLRKPRCLLRFIVVILRCGELSNIHSRLCEVVVALMNAKGGFPDRNYVVYAKKDIAHLIGIIIQTPQMEFVASMGVPIYFAIDLMEALDIGCACERLSRALQQRIVQPCENSFIFNRNLYDLIVEYDFGDRIFLRFTHYSKKKKPLKYNFTDSQVLILCHKRTRSNITFPKRGYTPTQVSQFDYHMTGIPYMTIRLLPLRG